MVKAWTALVRHPAPYYLCDLGKSLDLSEAQSPPAGDELASVTTSGLNEGKRRIFVKHLDGRVRGKQQMLPKCLLNK